MKWRRTQPEQDVRPEVLEDITRTLAANCETVIKNAEHRKGIDPAKICESYIDTILNMMLPRSIVIEQKNLYKDLKDAEDHLRHDEANAIKEKLAGFGDERDIIKLRIKATAYLRSFISPEFQVRFDEAVDYKPELKAVMMLRGVADTAVRGYQTAQSMLAQL